MYDQDVEYHLPSLPRTGYEHIDLGLSEASSQNYLAYRALPDPITQRLYASTTNTMTPPGQALSPEFSFWTVASAYSVDSYLRTAVDKYIHLISKEGWTIKGQDQGAVDYVNLRLRLLQITSGVTFDALLRDIEYSIILFANAMIVRQAFKGKTPIPGLKINPVKGSKMKPVGGFFPVHPGLLLPVVDTNGVFTEWRFMIGGAIRATFTPDQVIHFTFNKPPTTLFGQPFFLPALEDIRTYRQLEWLVVALLNRYIHPLIHVRKGIDPSGKIVAKVEKRDIDETDALIKNMAPDGLIVTGPDVSINVQGVESQAIRAEGYLDAWRKRIFAGLSVSDIAMGEATSGSRSTADAITAEMHDMAKAIQMRIAQVINEQIVFYFLLEGGFDPITNKDVAYFEYNTIAIDEEIKRRNQTLAEWQSGAICEDELRSDLGRQPMTDQQRELTFPMLYGSQSAADAGQDNKLTTMSKGPARAVAAKSKPQNQHGTKSSPKGPPVAPPPKK